MIGLYLIILFFGISVFLNLRFCSSLRNYLDFIESDLSNLKFKVSEIQNVIVDYRQIVKNEVNCGKNKND